MRPALRATLLWSPAVLAAVLALRPVDNWDLGFQLRIGEWVAGHGIPVTDPFSFPGEGQPWALEQWLGPLALFLAWKGGGVLAVILLKAAVAGCALLLASLAARRCAGDPALGALAALLACSAGAVRFNAQAGIFSLAGVAAVLLSCCRRWSAAGARDLPWLLGLFALWPHVHPGYLTGLVVLGAWACGVAAEALLAPRLREGTLLRSPGGESVLRAVGITAACAGTAALSLLLFHPLGLQTLARVLSIFASSTNRGAIAEYAPLWRSYAIDAPLLALWLPPLLFWAVRRRGLPLPLLAPALLLGAQALQVGRLVTEASLVAAPVWGVAAAQALEALRAGGRIARLQSLLRPPRAAFAIVGAALVAGIGHLASAESRPLDWPDAYYPRRCYEWIDAAGLPARGFNDLGFGGSFIFHFGDRRKVFIDGRSFYSDRFFNEEYTPIKTAQPGFHEVARRWGIGWYLLHPRRFRALHQALAQDPSLVLLHLEPNCAVYGPAPARAGGPLSR